jgi:hypothetical protein
MSFGARKENRAVAGLTGPKQTDFAQARFLSGCCASCRRFHANLSRRPGVSGAAIFQIITDVPHFSAKNSHQGNIEANPDACVLIGYLKKVKYFPNERTARNVQESYAKAVSRFFRFRSFDFFCVLCRPGGKTSR